MTASSNGDGAVNSYDTKRRYLTVSSPSNDGDGHLMIRAQNCSPFLAFFAWYSAWYSAKSRLLIAAGSRVFRRKAAGSRVFRRKFRRSSLSSLWSCHIRLFNRTTINCWKVRIISSPFAVNQSHIIWLEHYLVPIRPQRSNSLQQLPNTSRAHSHHRVNLRFVSRIFVCFC